MSFSSINGIIGKVQEAQAKSFEEKLQKEAAARKALRSQDSNNVSELLEKLYSVPEEEVVDVREVKQRKTNEPRKVPTSVPPPILSDGKSSE